MDYRSQAFQSQRGRGFKSSYYDMATGEAYWISGCRKDGRDALYGTEFEIEEDALEEYWVNIRRQPENKQLRRFRAPGKD